MSKFIDANKDGIDDNQSNEGNEQDNEKVDDIKRGMSNFQSMQNEFFSPADKEDTARSGLQLGLAADAIGKGIDSGYSKDMANFQSAMYKDNSKFGADLQYDFDSKTRADEFGYGMRFADKTLEVENQLRDYDFGRNIGMEQATGEQRRKDLKETGAQARETYDFQDTVDARGEERDRGRANRLARSF
jgi:hypothetical protein